MLGDMIDPSAALALGRGREQLAAARVAGAPQLRGADHQQVSTRIEGVRYAGAGLPGERRGLLAGDFVEPSLFAQLRVLSSSAFGVILFSANCNRPKELA